MPPLAYNGGPVMGSQSTVGEATIYPIFWGAANAFPGTYRSLIDQYLADVEAASGTPGNTFAVDTQYYETAATDKIHYDVHFGGELDSTDLFPSTGNCRVDIAGFSACLTDAQVITEVRAVISRNHLPTDTAHLYMVYLPPDVETCFDATNAQCSVGGPTGSFCGYHDWVTSSGTTLLYANMPYPVLNGCPAEESPNANPAADSIINITSHEANEAITDPVGTGWLDHIPPPNQNEIGDECDFVFGNPTGGSGTAEYNQTINGHNYFVQEEFSNEAYAQDHGGCVQRQQLPVASISAPSAAEAGLAVNVNGTGSADPNGSIPAGLSYTWNWGDGTATSPGATSSHLYAANGAYVISLTVTNSDGWVSTPATQNISVNPSPSPSPSPSPPTVASTNPGAGYWLLGSDGGIFSFGSAAFYGSMGGQRLNAPIVGLASTPTGRGYLEVATDGGIFAFGDATFYGSMGGQRLNRPIVGMVVTSDGHGYWLVASDGGIFAFGDAGFYGSTGAIALNRPIVGMAVTPDGGGYWLVASDGGIFAFGDAGFFGSTGGQALNAPVVGMSPSVDGQGYQEVTSDGGIFAYGDAPFLGSMGSQPLNAPIVSLAVPTTGAGYWEVATDGGIFGFGSAPFLGSMGGQRLNAPIVAIASVA